MHMIEPDEKQEGAEEAAKADEAPKEEQAA